MHTANRRNNAAPGGLHASHIITAFRPAVCRSVPVHAARRGAKRIRHARRGCDSKRRHCRRCASRRYAAPNRIGNPAEIPDGIGGKDAWSGITTRSMKGIYQTEDLSAFAGIEIIAEAPNKTFTKITFPRGIAVREVCDGKSAWVEDPRGGVHQFTGAALESRLRQASFANTGETLLLTLTGRLLGTAQVGAHSTYVMEFSPAKNITSKVYFDVASGLAVRADDTLHRDQGDYTVQTYMDDYRPVDGAYYPFRIRHVEQGNVFTVRITQVKNNPPVDDSVFLKTDSATVAQ